MTTESQQSENRDPPRRMTGDAWRSGTMPQLVRRGLRTGLLLAVGVAAALSAQDGTLVDRQTVVVDDAQIRAAFDGERLERMRELLEVAAEGVHLESVTYMSDGLRVKGYLASPVGGTDLPCVIFARGGNREFGALDDLRATRILGNLARAGYVAVASQYRGVAGGEGMEEFGGREIHDVLNLIPLLERLPEADASRIGIYGWSRGGLMTYLALTRTDRFKAAVVGAGLTDAFAGVQQRPDMEEHVYSELVPEWETNREAELEARSPIRWPEKLAKSTPILLLHGSSDWRVDPTQALRMASALYDAKHPFRLVFFEGGDHGLTKHRQEVERLLVEWLNRFVRDGETWPSLEPHGR